MKSQHLSRKTLGAQFIVRLMRGKVAFGMRSRKCGLNLINLLLKRKLLKPKTSKTVTLKTEIPYTY